MMEHQGRQGIKTRNQVEMLFNDKHCFVVSRAVLQLQPPWLLWVLTGIKGQGGKTRGGFVDLLLFPFFM